MDELRMNDGNCGNDLWVLIDGKIYDLTNYDHPGGPEVFEQNPMNYQDMYEDFMNAGHSSTATRLMKKFYVGDLEY